MRKLSLVLMSLLMTVALIGCSSGKYKDGTYTGVGRGASSDIKVEVSVKGGKIEDIKLVEQKETATLVQGVQDNIIPEIIKKQGTEGIDTLSGATNSSKGVLDAVNVALGEAIK